MSHNMKMFFFFLNSMKFLKKHTQLQFQVEDLVQEAKNMLESVDLAIENVCIILGQILFIHLFLFSFFFFLFSFFFLRINYYTIIKTIFSFTFVVVKDNLWKKKTKKGEDRANKFTPSSHRRSISLVWSNFKII